MSDFDGGQVVAAVGRQYQLVIANQAVKPLTGSTVALATGKSGDVLDQVWIQFATLAPGIVSIFDGRGANAVNVWEWPAGIVPANLAPVFVPLNLKAVVNRGAADGGFYITTGANLRVLASGQFS